MGSILLRQLLPDDYAYLTSVIDDWWGGRAVRALLPRVFFEHFNETSFVLEDNKDRIAFLVGFISQSRPTIAYIHFVGVSPEHRGRGLGRNLYQHFAAVAASHGCDRIQCVTSPTNSGSIQFHRKMGFGIEPGDGEVAGIAVTLHYSGDGEHRVRFTKRLSPQMEADC